ncbi:DUF6207 family protein [Streptomyces massasporeus]
MRRPGRIRHPGQLAGRRATATATRDRTTQVPSEPGVRLRCYLDVRQELAPR